MFKFGKKYWKDSEVKPEKKSEEVNEYSILRFPDPLPYDQLKQKILAILEG